jgi:hypothetical protein
MSCWTEGVEERQSNSVRIGKEEEEEQTGEEARQRYH